MNKINPNHGMGWNKPDELPKDGKPVPTSFDKERDELRGQVTKIFEVSRTNLHLTYPDDNPDLSELHIVGVTLKGLPEMRAFVVGELMELIDAHTAKAVAEAEKRGELLSLRKMQGINDLWASPDTKDQWLNKEISRLEQELSNSAPSPAQENE